MAIEIYCREHDIFDCWFHPESSVIAVVEHEDAQGEVISLHRADDAIFCNHCFSAKRDIVASLAAICRFWVEWAQPRDLHDLHTLDIRVWEREEDQKGPFGPQQVLFDADRMIGCRLLDSEGSLIAYSAVRIDIFRRSANNERIARKVLL